MKPTVSFTESVCAYFEKAGDTGCPVLRLADLTGARRQSPALPGCASEARFSPNGRWLYFSCRTDSTGDGIFRVKTEGGEPQTVIDWKKSSEKYFDLSPDGAGLVFGSNGNGTWQLFLTDTAARSPVCLTGGGDNISPLFSPSGEYCAFLSNRTSFGGAYDVWLCTIATGEVRQLTSNAKVNDFRWLPDAKTIVCSAGAPLATLHVVSTDSNTCARLIEGDSAMAYAERTPRPVMVKNGWKILYTREYDDGTRKIFWVNLDGSGDRRIVNSKGQDWLE